MRLSRIVFTAAVALGALLAAQAEAIIIRHDREDAKYLELGARFPEVGFIGRDGEGTLVAPQWVLTAAHVARGIPPNLRRVIFEDVDYQIAEVFIHPDWKGRGPHDIALLRLSEPVKGVTPAALYTGTDEAGRIVTFVGRGDTGTGLTGPKLADKKKRGATNKVDAADANWLYFTFDDPATATDLEGISGPGDSGGPALLEINGKRYVAGVSVWGNPGKQGRGTYGAKEGYTRVSSHHEWIAATLAGKTQASAAANAQPAARAASGQSAGAPQLPDTQAGQRAAAYFRAFNSGDEQAMRDFFTSHLAPASLARRTMDERLQVYRQMRGEMEMLEVQRVLEARDSAITVLVRGKNGDWLTFGFEFEPQPPHKLLGIRVENTGPAADGAAPATSEAQPPMTEREVVAALEAYLDELAKADEFSGVALLAKNGKPIFQKAYGLASQEYQTPNRVDTKFNLGSINKIFTKIAIGQLIERGKLSFDDPISNHLPDYPNRQAADKVTIRHLLEHRSGIGDIFGEKYDATPKSQLRRIADYLPLFTAAPLAFEPGTKRQYSNGGYLVLGAIIEKASGQSYYDYVREQIFKPAGMDNTDSYEADVPTPNLASGYTRRGPGGASGTARRNNLYSRPARGSSGGGGYSTAEDLLKFTLALHQRKLLTPEYTEWILTGTLPARAAGAGNTNAAQGRQGDSGGLGIGGGAPGINAVVEMDLASGYTAIVLSNYDPPSAENVGRKIRGWLARLPK
jgi:D-alanyl-D-alanine carboxypeptidase